MTVSTQSAKTHDGETTVKKADGKTLYGAVADAKDQKERRDSGQDDVNMTDAAENDENESNTKSSSSKGDGASYTKEQSGVKGKDGKQVYGAAAKAMKQKGNANDDDDDNDVDDQDQTKADSQPAAKGQGAQHNKKDGAVKSKDGKKVYGVAAEKMRQKGNAADDDAAEDDALEADEAEEDNESSEQTQSSAKSSGDKYNKSSGGVKNADGKMVYGAAAKALKAQGKGEEQQDDQDDQEQQDDENDKEDSAPEQAEDDDDAAYVPPAEDNEDDDEEDEPAEDAKSGSQSPQKGTKRGRTTKSPSSPNKKQKEQKETVGSRHDPAEAPGKQGSKDRLPRKGQQVHWKALPGYVDGKVVEIVTSDKEIDGKTYKGSESEPKIVLKSSSSGKMCVHKPDAVYFD